MSELEKDLEQELEETIPAFDLEDIMKEFGGEEEHQVPETSADDILEAVMLEAGVLETQEETPGEEAAQLTGDTIVMELGDTRRFGDEETAQIQQAAQEPVPEQPAEEPEQPQPEPFSQQWEPSYEQPMGEYIPPEPIVFRPRSRLRELKRKLVAGPEKRYYELMERGVGRLQAAIFLSFIIVLLSSGALVLHAVGMVRPDRLKLLIFGEVLAMLVAALLGCYQLLAGIGSLFRGRFTPDSMLVFTFAACCADGWFCLEQMQVPFCGAFCLQVMMSLWAEYQRRNAEMGKMDTMRKATRLDSVVKVPGFYNGRSAFLRGEGQVEDFMDHYAKRSGPERAMSRYLAVALVVAVAGGIAVGILAGGRAGVRVGTAALLAALPASGFITLSRPAAVLERRLHRVGAVICGWRGVKGMRGAAAVPVSDEDLFPAGSVKMNGVKFYGDRDPDEVVAYATAVITAGGAGLSSLFEQLLDSRNGRHYDAENFQVYKGGLGGEVNGEPVLVGKHSFLRDMGMELPEGTRVHQAVYVAIDGVLCGVFAITYSKVRHCVAGLSTLCGSRRLTPVLTCGDFMLTESFLRSKFGVNTRRIAFPDHPVRRELAAVTPDPEAKVLALMTETGLRPMACAIVGARALRTASIWGAVLHIAAGILGLAAVAVLAAIQSMDLLTAERLMLFELAWLIPGFLISEWTRSV